MPSDRLPSLKIRRDLSLANSLKKPVAAEKKKFIPNVNVQRKKPVCRDVYDNVSLTVNNGLDSKNGKISNSQKRQFNRPTFIQSTNSVFADGVSGGIKRSVRESDYRSNESRETGIPPPALSSIASRSAPLDKNEEETKLQELFRDDFLSAKDLTSLQGKTLPVVLPLIKTGRGDFKDIDSQATHTSQSVRALHRITDDDSIAESTDKSDLVESAPFSPSRSERHSKNTQEVNRDENDITFFDLIKQQKGDILLIQIPSIWPFIAHEMSNMMNNLSCESNAADDDHEKSSHDSSGSNSKRDGDRKSETKCRAGGCAPISLADVPDGYLGKIQIHKSGRCRLKLCDSRQTSSDQTGPKFETATAYLNIDTATQVAFLEQVATLQLQTCDQTGPTVGIPPINVADFTVLGQVKHRVTISPDWAKLTAVSNPNPNSDDSDNS